MDLQLLLRSTRVVLEEARVVRTRGGVRHEQETVQVRIFELHVFREHVTFDSLLA